MTLTNYLAELGDATGDGNVDAADLSVWEDNYGASADFSAGDFDNDGAASGNDFLAWQRHVAGASSLATAATLTPEPSSVALLLLIVPSIVLPRRRARR